MRPPDGAAEFRAVEFRIVRFKSEDQLVLCCIVEVAGGEVGEPFVMTGLEERHGKLLVGWITVELLRLSRLFSESGMRRVPCEDMPLRLLLTRRYR